MVSGELSGANRFARSFFLSSLASSASPGLSMSRWCCHDKQERPSANEKRGAFAGHRKREVDIQNDFSPTHRVLAGARSSRSFAISAQSREGERGRGRGRGARGEEQGRKRHEEENKKQKKNLREGRTEGLEEKKRKLLQVSCWLAPSLSLSPPPSLPLCPSPSLSFSHIQSERIACALVPRARPFRRVRAHLS